MANPQKENGYTAIANELADSFCCLRLSDQEWRVLWTIIRFSYGWNRKKACLTLKQMGEKTGIDVRHLPAIIKKLSDKYVVIRDGKKFWLQKDYEMWNSPKRVKKVTQTGEQKSHKQVTPEQVKKFTQTGDKKSPEQVNGNNENTLKNKELQPPKDSFKDIYKDISLRERVFLKLKICFPKLIIPDSIPTERMDYFLYLIETGGIKAERIESPVAYMMSSRLVIEPFPSIVEREEADRRKKEEEQERKRVVREERERKRLTREDITGDEDLMKLVTSVKDKLGMNDGFHSI